MMTVTYCTKQGRAQIVAYSKLEFSKSIRFYLPTSGYISYITIKRNDIISIEEEPQ